MASKSRYPAGLDTAGRRLWKSITDGNDTEEHEKAILLEACRTADRLDRLADAQSGQPLTVRNSKGDEVAHPLLTESRQQSITFSRLIAALRIPDSEGEQPQRRGGARGTYGATLKAVE